MIIYYFMAKRLNKAVFVLCSILLLTLLTGCSGGEKADPKPMPTPIEALIKKDASAKPENSSVTGSTDAGNSIDPTSLPDETEDSELDEADIPEAKEKNGYVVVLDPGHGGSYPGAIYFGKNEKDLTLSVANYVRDYLNKNYEGISVFLTRESDIALDPDLKIELENRAIIAELHEADFFVSLHFNASEEHQVHGTTVYASFRDNVAEKSQGMASSILKQLVALGIKNNDVKTRVSKDYFAEDGSRLDYYAVIRHNALRDIPAVIVEHCFMDNEIDVEFMNTDEKLRILAEADAKGIAEYLNLTKINE